MSIESRKRLWDFFQAIYGQELSAISPGILQPAWIRTPLLNHQSAAVSAALSLEKAKHGMQVGALPGDTEGGLFFTPYGILADAVGTGKSLIALSLVKEVAPEPRYCEYIARSGTIGDGRDVGILRQRSQTTLFLSGITLTPVTASLFIVPHSVINQWETYVIRDTTLNTLFIKKRQDAIALELTQLNQYDAIFISSTIYNYVRHRFHSILWKRLFIDEADSINISNNHDDLHACFYWLISASFMNLLFPSGSTLNVRIGYPPLPETPQWIQKRISKLVNPAGMLVLTGLSHNNIVRRICGDQRNLWINSATIQSSRLLIHSTDASIQTSFPSPAVIRHANILCATPQNILVLREFITPEMLDRLNAGDLGGALEMAGMSTGSKAEITEVVTVSLKTELENAKRTLEFKIGLIYSSDISKQKAIETCETKIASLESRILAIQERIASEHICPICYCDVSGAAVVPCCKQIMCFTCLCQCLKVSATCPLCRAPITDLKSISVVEKQKHAGDMDISGNTLLLTPPVKMLNKCDAFVKYVMEHPHARILMFSSYDASFSMAFSQLAMAGMNVTVLGGSAARITKILRDFSDGKYNVLFLNARNMGTGLNIEAATHVVLFHKMPAELEEQIVGRAMRLGRTADLDVIHLVHENERTESVGVLTHV